MRLTRTSLLAAFGALLTVALLPLAINIATSRLPDWMDRYRTDSWLAVGVLSLLTVGLAIAAARASSDISGPDQSDLDAITSLINEAVQVTKSDPALKKEENWAGILAEWKEAVQTLINTFDAQSNRRDQKSREIANECAQLLIQLTKATIPSFSLRGKRIDLIEIGSSAYKVGLTHKNWIYAAEMSYEVAKAHHDSSHYQKCKEWLAHLEDCLEHIEKNPLCNELQSKFLDMKGLSLLNTGIPEVQKYFEDALAFAQKTTNSTLIWRITLHLGELADRRGETDKAIKLYTEVLENTEDIDLKLESYNKLGRLAFGEGDLDNAYNYYIKQLNISKESARTPFEARAHEGLAQTLQHLKSPNLREAYLHASQALKIEEDLQGSEEKKLRNLAIKLADKIILEG